MDKIPDFTLVRSRRRSVSIQITPEGIVEVRAPLLSPYGAISQFVRDKSDWIYKHLGNIQKKQRKTKQYLQGEKFMYLGNIYKLHIGNYKQIHVTDRLNFPDFLEFRIKSELTHWYINEAKMIITERVEYYSKVMKAEHKGIMFSDTKSKWGTCSHDNNLQFNWRLVMSSLLVIDYVVVHELAHISEKNHSAKFWLIVKKYKPAYKQYRKWLGSNSHKLTL